MYSNLTSIGFSGKSKNIIANNLIATVGQSGGVGVLEAVIVSSHTSGTIKFWDNIAGTGTVLVDTFTYAAGSQTINFFGPMFVKGLYADLGGTTQSITVVYNI